MSEVAGLLMAAGSARRMGGPNKLLMPWRGVPLVLHAARAMANAGFCHRLAVTGRDGAAMARLLDEVAIACVPNPRFEEGFGTSLAVGFPTLSADRPDGIMVMLGDMPLITADMMDAMIEGFSTHRGQAVVRAANGTEPGNPVILPRALFEAVCRLEGDSSAKHIIAASGIETVLVDIGPAALTDVDTREAYRALDGGAV